MLRKKSMLMGLAIAATLMPLSFVFHDGRITFLMMRDSPAGAGAFWVAAAGLWVAFTLVARRLRGSGL